MLKVKVPRDKSQCLPQDVWLSWGGVGGVATFVSRVQTASEASGSDLWTSPCSPACPDHLSYAPRMSLCPLVSCCTAPKVV